MEMQKLATAAWPSFQRGKFLQ